MCCDESCANNTSLISILNVLSCIIYFWFSSAWQYLLLCWCMMDTNVIYCNCFSNITLPLLYWVLVVFKFGWIILYQLVTIFIQLQYVTTFLVLYVQLFIPFSFSLCFEKGKQSVWSINNGINLEFKNRFVRQKFQSILIHYIYVVNLLSLRQLLNLPRCNF